MGRIPTRGEEISPTLLWNFEGGEKSPPPFCQSLKGGKKSPPRENSHPGSLVGLEKGVPVSYVAQLSPKRLAAKRMKDMRSHTRRLTNKRGKTHSEIKLCWCKFLGKKMRYCLFEARGVDDFLFQGTSQQLVAQFGWELCWKSTKSNHF